VVESRTLRQPWWLAAWMSARKLAGCGARVAETVVFGDGLQKSPRLQPSNDSLRCLVNGPKVLNEHSYNFPSVWPAISWTSRGGSRHLGQVDGHWTDILGLGAGLD
jgi:hypothetical protein